MNTVAKPKSSQPAKSSFLGELFRVGIYKPSQGRIVRQVTFVASVILLLLTAMGLAKWDLFSTMFQGSNYVFGLAFSVVAVWLAYRLVNYSAFADFLIAVEAEMNKVSWPTWPELWRASVVVMVVIFVMAVSLYLFDIAWTFLFRLLGVRYGG